MNEKIARVVARENSDGMDIRNKSVNVGRPDFAFRPYYHEFTCPAEAGFYLNDESRKSMEYFFSEDPRVDRSDDENTWEGNVIKVQDNFSVLEGLRDVVIMFMIYLDESKRVCYKFAPVWSSAEVGSKHAEIGESISNSSECMFMYAGEIIWSTETGMCFNFMSGTFMKVRSDFLIISIETADNDAKKPEFAEHLDTLDGAFAQDLCKELLTAHYPGVWAFKSHPFSTKSPFSLDTLFRHLKLSSLPFVMPADKDLSDIARQAIIVISAHRLCKKMNKYPSVGMRVNAFASEYSDVIATGAGLSEIVRRNMFGRDRPLSVAPFGDEHIYVNMSPEDLPRALSALKASGARRLGSSFRTPNVNLVSDIHGLIGRHLTLQTADGVKTLRVHSYLGKGNTAVYLGSLDNKQVVVKADNLYVELLRELKFNPVSPSTTITSTLDKDAKFYGEKCYRFKLPNSFASVTVFPYMGKTIDSMPLDTRIKNIKKFRTQIVKHWCSVGFYPNYKTGGYQSGYNDFKPANTCFDSEGNFHLIDLDANSCTPAYYGDDQRNGVQDQMFGLAVMMYWFETDVKLFIDKRYTFAEKVESVLTAFVDWSYYGRVFRLILDDGSAKVRSYDEIADIFEC